MSIDFSNSDFDPQDMEEPLVTTSLTREDENEYSLRPKTLREYIGQEKAKGNLAVFIAAAKKRGFLISGGEYDLERMAGVLLDEYRGGKLGRITLEMPEAEV